MNITTIRNEEKKTHSDAHMQACTDARIILKQFLKIIPVDIIKWLSSSSHPFIHSFFVCVCACIVCKLNASVCECVCMSTLSEKKKNIEFEQSKPNRNKATIFMWASRMRAKKTRSNCFVYRSPLVRLIFHLRVLSVCSLFGFLYSAAFFHYYFQEKREECACSILNTT